MNDHAKPKYGEKTKLRHTDTNNFMVHVKSENFNKEIITPEQVQHIILAIHKTTTHKQNKK